jgi:transcriptional adapter 3
MPPAPSQKGTGKKASGGKAQRSRNTTPMSSLPTGTNATSTIPPVELLESELLDVKYEYLRNILYDDIIDQNTSNAVIPDSKTLDALVQKLQKLEDLIDRRGSWCDKAMRLLVIEKRGHVDEPPPAPSRKEASQEGENKPNKKKRKPNENLAPGDQNIGKSL